jgi:hypothetical protein
MEREKKYADFLDSQLESSRFYFKINVAPRLLKGNVL